MKTIEINLYSFNELSEQVKEKVLEKYRFFNVEDTFWYECIFDNWKERLQNEGFEDAEIFFSGFYSQGDGACFDAKINVNNFSAPERIKKIAIEYCDFRICKNSYANHYSHEKTRFVDYDNVGKDNIGDNLSNLSEQIEQKRLQLCREIYRELETDYEYLTSNEQVAESLMSNEYTFEENGKMRN